MMNSSTKCQCHSCVSGNEWINELALCSMGCKPSLGIVPRPLSILSCLGNILTDLNSSHVIDKDLQTSAFSWLACQVRIMNNERIKLNLIRSPVLPLVSARNKSGGEYVYVNPTKVLIKPFKIEDGPLHTKLFVIRVSQHGGR